MSINKWELNQGDTQGAAKNLIDNKEVGALLQVELEHESLTAFRLQNPTDESRSNLLMIAWNHIIEVLPEDTVGRRALWSRFEFILKGSQVDLVPLNQKILANFDKVEILKNLNWHFLFIEIFGDDASRIFKCDPNYLLLSADSKTAIAWIRPYDGADWRESQRYPEVTILGLSQRSRGQF